MVTACGLKGTQQFYFKSKCFFIITTSLPMQLMKILISNSVGTSFTFQHLLPLSCVTCVQAPDRVILFVFVTVIQSENCAPIYPSGHLLMDTPLPPSVEIAWPLGFNLEHFSKVWMSIMPSSLKDGKHPMQIWLWKTSAWCQRLWKTAEHDTTVYTWFSNSCVGLWLRRSSKVWGLYWVKSGANRIKRKWP